MKYFKQVNDTYDSFKNIPLLRGLTFPNFVLEYNSYLNDRPY